LCVIQDFLYYPGKIKQNRRLVELNWQLLLSRLYRYNSQPLYGESTTIQTFPSEKGRQVCIHHIITLEINHGASSSILFGSYALVGFLYLTNGTMPQGKLHNRRERLRNHKAHLLSAIVQHSCYHELCFPFLFIIPKC